MTTASDALPQPRTRLLRPGNWLVRGALALIALLIAYPLLFTLVHLLSDASAGAEQLRDAAGAGTLWKVLVNTAIVVLAAVAIAFVVGAAIAWTQERTDAQLGRLGDLLPLGPLLVPPLAGVIGWAILLDPHVGFLNVLIRAGLRLIGVNLTAGPFNIYTLAGLVGVTVLYLVPYVFLVISAALRRLDPALEEASRIGGAGPVRTLLRVTLPSIRPALAAAILLAIISGLGLFSVPIVLGSTARIDVLSVYIFRLFQNYPPQIAPALLLSAGMLIVVQLLLLLQRLVVRQGESAAIGGKGFRGTRLRLGRWRLPARGIAIFYLAATSIVPLVGLVILSLQQFWTPVINWARLSLANYHFVLFESGPTSRALATSLVLAVLVGTVTMLVAGLIMLRVHLRRGLGRRSSDLITSLPATIPHTVIGIAFLIAFSRAPFNFYGTALMLFLAYFIMAIPFAARAANSAAAGVGPELAEASRIFGASERKTFFRILLPLALPGLIAGWIIVFIHTVGEVTASALLAGARNPVMGRMLMELWVFGNFPQVAALALVMTAINAVCVGVMLWVTRRNFETAVT